MVILFADGEFQIISEGPCFACFLETSQSIGVRNAGASGVACRSEVMTGCLLVGASYALLTTQTHAVGAVAAVGMEDSKVRAIEPLVV